MSLDGFRLEFPDSTVFRTTETVGVTHQLQPLWLIDGLRQFVTLYNEYLDSGGQSGRADSNYAAVFEGFGAGVHQIQLNFNQWKGNTDSWGSAANSDEAVKKMQILNRKITTTRVSSSNPALLQVSEYSDSGQFSEIPVAIGETNLQFTPDDGATFFTGDITFYEAIDTSQPVDSIVR